MYKEFFKLNDIPFSDNKDEKFYYPSKHHEEAIARMLYAIESKKAIALLTGEPGIGKSYCTQKILSELNDNIYKIALVLAYPKMTKIALLEMILDELMIEYKKNKRNSFSYLLELLTNEIVKNWQAHKRVIIIIDEAHFLNSDCLHILRTLTNLETPEEKLLTIIFDSLVFL